ncbi:MAG TPA: TonB-dependent receptor, partial [Thermoanaerobaculia bacterium]|nr:TonB-dependent receptor [Thermoanaerobaculia bacterium]
VDAPAGGRHGTAELTVERLPDDAGGPLLFLRGGVFDEERDNGTRLQVNATTVRHAAAGADWTTGTGGLTLRAWGADHDFFQTFTAVADDRASERLVREQRVPSEALGGSLRWTRAAGGRHTWVAGVEAERTEGVSRERGFLAGGAVTDSAAGGRQRAAALHVEDVAVLGPRLSLAAGLRYDRWEDDPAAGGAVRDADLLSPRLALRWQPRPAWGVTAAAYRSFRAPTLNELYRGFRVGDVVTEPNAELAAERLTGAEVGTVWTPAAPGRPRLRGTAFWMEVDDPVANVTLDAGPDLIRRQRRNLGRTRSRGVEIEGEAAWGDGWRLAGGHLWSEAEVVDFPADPALEGRRVPQVPEHQGALALSRQGRRAAAALAARWSSRQFDDDRNLLPLGGFVVVDLRLAWRPRPALEVYAAAENLLDEEVTVGRTPLRTVGAPRLVRVGLRWRRGGDGRPEGTPAATATDP